MLEGPLPKRPKRVPVAAQHALSLYDRLFRRRPTPEGLRRRAVSARLDRALERLTAVELAAYYGQLADWRRQDG